MLREECEERRQRGAGIIPAPAAEPRHGQTLLTFVPPEELSRPAEPAEKAGRE